MKQNLNINIQDPYYTYVKNGIKKIEGRLHKSKFRDIRTGDEITVNEELQVKIIRKTLYTSFKDMISCEGFQKLIPDAKNLEDAEAVYTTFYSKEDEIRFGVVALEIELK